MRPATQNVISARRLNERATGCSMTVTLAPRPERPRPRPPMAEPRPLLDLDTTSPPWDRVRGLLLCGPRDRRDANHWRSRGPPPAKGVVRCGWIRLLAGDLDRTKPGSAERDTRARLALTLADPRQRLQIDRDNRLTERHLRDGRADHGHVDDLGRLLRMLRGRCG